MTDKSTVSSPTMDAPVHCHNCAIVKSQGLLLNLFRPAPEQCPGATQQFYPPVLGPNLQREGSTLHKYFLLLSTLTVPLFPHFSNIVLDFVGIFFFKNAGSHFCFKCPFKHHKSSGAAAVLLLGFHKRGSQVALQSKIGGPTKT